ncbi:transcriptional regulator [Bradyrhizobium liaoningense]|uniref:WYL domain-containing protein n=1 Tax=Bradyrhizobium TaxID=374 RepID=UPI001BAA6721|nr:MULTISPECIES: transcriptional regulator [Bradyrhizobium]MBR0878549.1 transcriptional regulator [Bradyrhizobium liaoningense]UQD98224.1 transcriptional regulator [Bradyrhizobium japonicum]
MDTVATGLRWGVERRLEFVEFRLFWEEGVNRSDLVEEFGVSVPQASKDLALYQEQAPDNIRYDRSLKRYFASDTFRPKFIELDAAAYLERLTPNSHQTRGVDVDGLGAAPLRADKLPIPQRRIRADVLRGMLASARGGHSIEILYQSMNAKRSEPMWRRISPHAFGSDGLRWHVRAYCHIDEKFKDFILSRCLDSRAPGRAGGFASEDRFWNTRFSVQLAPNPRLTKGQKEIVAQDFAMEHGKVAVPVRCALLYYFSKRLRLDVADRFDNPGEAPVIVKNRDEFDAALSEAMR